MLNIVLTGTLLAVDVDEEVRRVGREGAEGVVDLRRLVQLAQHYAHDLGEADGVVVDRRFKPHVDTSG